MYNIDVEVEVEIGGNCVKKNNQKINNPLTMIGVFSTIAEIAMAATLINLGSEMQETFIWFVMLFPCLLVGLFFFVLYKKPHVLYAPSDFKDEENYLKTVTSIKIEQQDTESDIKKDNNRESIINKSFTNEVVEIENKKFLNCTFDHCEIIFSGQGILTMDSCIFIECAWTLTGNALFTIKFISTLYTMGEAGKITIEKTFDHIREGKYLS